LRPAFANYAFRASAGRHPIDADAHKDWLDESEQAPLDAIVAACSYALATATLLCPAAKTDLCQRTPALSADGAGNREANSVH
jgi:hypothetical protein